MKKLAYIFTLAVVSNCTYAEPTSVTSAVASAVKRSTNMPSATAAAKNAATGAHAVTKTESAKLDVRIPEGDVEKFWNKFNWDDLSADEKKLWGVLGWNSKLWATKTESKSAPTSESTAWNILKQEEQDAAAILGYDQQSWDQK